MLSMSAGQGRRSRLVMALGLGLLTGTMARAADDGEFVLKYAFQPGTDVAYTIDSQSQIFLQQGEAQQHVQHGSLTERRYIVKSVDDEGNAIVELQIDQVKLSAETDGGEPVNYDSASGEEPPDLFKGFEQSIGKPNVRVKVSPRGEVLAIDWLTGGTLAPTPTLDDAAALDILVMLPGTPIRVGDTWKQQFEAEVAATPTLKKKVTLQREYTLKDVRGEQATIELRTAVLTPLHEPAQESQLMGKTPRGTIVFDLARGVVVSRSLGVDKTVVGFRGPDSKVRNLISWRETLHSRQIAAGGDDETRSN